MEESSVKHIRTRLFKLLFISYGIVILLSILMLLGAVVWTVMQSVNDSPLAKMAVIGRLEGYYIGNQNSWDGVDEALTGSDTGSGFWRWSMLLDKNNQVLLNLNKNTGSPVGSTYLVQPNDISVNLVMDNEVIGRVVFHPESTLVKIRLLSTIFTPIAGIGIVLAIFMMLSDYFIVRRLINPLASTIAAAKQVTAGNLKARVDLTGPDDMISLNKTFNQMIETLDESNTQRQEFLTDIAHELRTPLTIMRGRLEGIVDHVYPADEVHIAPVLQETYLMERLVDDLRTLTLAETRQLRFDPKRINLEDAIVKIYEVFQPLAESQKIAVELELPEQPLYVCTDPQRFEQVLGNIVHNSIKYIKAEGKIIIACRAADDCVLLTISDNGPGVADADLANLFTRFWRKEKSRSRSTGGSGLGLAIARQLVEAQGGTIHAEKAEIGGLKVVITLPKEKVG